MKLVLLTVIVCLCAIPFPAGAEWGRAPNGEFWNARAKRFIFAPTFAFTNVCGAAKYVHEIVDDRHRVLRIESEGPIASLRPVWGDLPVGFVTVVCRGTDADGVLLAEAGRRTFWKKAEFTGRYEAAKSSYDSARNRLFSHFLGLPCISYLLEHRKPDSSYPLNGYPSKMLSATIDGAVAVFRSSIDEADCRSRALDVACAAADYLVAESVPEGAPLAYFTRTYAKEGSEYGRFAGEQDRIMLMYPAAAGLAFLRLYGISNDPRYLEASRRIALTYLKLQGKDGTWFLVQNAVTGRELAANRLLPTDVIEFLEALYEIDPQPEYRAATDRAFGYVEAGPMQDWNWEGQFEDVKPARGRWSNLSKHPACSVAQYLLRRYPGDVRRLEQAESLFRFAEDQFVEWVPPYGGRGPGDDRIDDGSWACFCRPHSSWATPCALEQYECYFPIDASAAKIIDTALLLWRATDNPDYLAKARALGDTATRMQEPDGLIRTWWVKGVKRDDSRYHNWLNCLIATGLSLDRLASVESVGTAGRLK